MAAAPGFTHQDLVEWAGETSYAAGAGLVAAQRAARVTVKRTGADVWAYATLGEGKRRFSSDSSSRYNVLLDMPVACANAAGRTGDVAAHSISSTS